MKIYDKNIVDRFISKAVISNGGCWEWTARKRSGYGQFRLGGKDIQASRFSYELFNNKKIQDKLVIDHLCRNPGCVNPRHLEEVTERINITRGIAPSSFNAKKTHCNKGHPLFGENLYIEKKTNGRRCKRCHDINHGRNKNARYDF